MRHIDKTILTIFALTSALYADTLTPPQIPAESTTIKIDEGWNLLTNPTSSTISASSLPINLKVWTFDQSWNSNVTQISSCQGFWLNSAVSGEWTVDGAQQTQTFESLNDGWNLVGTGMSLVNPAENYGLERIWAFKDNQWTQDPPYIEAGQGFWVYGKATKNPDGSSTEEPTQDESSSDTPPSLEVTDHGLENTGSSSVQITNIVMTMNGTITVSVSGTTQSAQYNNVKVDYASGTMSGSVCSAGYCQDLASQSLGYSLIDFPLTLPSGSIQSMPSTIDASEYASYESYGYDVSGSVTTSYIFYTSSGEYPVSTVINY